MEVRIIFEVPNDDPILEDIRMVCGEFVKQMNLAHPESNAHFVIQGA